MEIKTNKIYYVVKQNSSHETMNYRTVIEYDDYKSAKDMFNICFRTYEQATIEEKSKMTCFLSRVIRGEDEVLAFFGSSLAFQGAPYWVAPWFSSYFKEG